MTRITPSRSKLAVVGALAALTLGVTACAAPQPATPSGSDEPDALDLDIAVVDEIAALVPDTLVEDGALTFPITSIGEPLSAFDEQEQAVGVIPDMLTAVAAVLGLEAKPQRTQSDGSIPGLDAHRFDLTAEAADLPTRRAEYILVNYLRSGAGMLVAAGNPLGIETKADLCGLRVAVAKSSLQESMAHEQSEACVAGGEEEIQITSIADSSLQLPIVSDRADASWIPLSSAEYLAATQPDVFGVTGTEFLVDIAMMFRQDDAALATAVKAALEELRRTGVYDEILEHHRQAIIAVDDFNDNIEG